MEDVGQNVRKMEEDDIFHFLEDELNIFEKTYGELISKVHRDSVSGNDELASVQKQRSSLQETSEQIKTMETNEVREKPKLLPKPKLKPKLYPKPNTAKYGLK